MSDANEISPPPADVGGVEMPHVRDIWPEYETRWWPEGVANPNAPAPVAL